MYEFCWQSYVGSSTNICLEIAYTAETPIHAQREARGERPPAADKGRRRPWPASATRGKSCAFGANGHREGSPGAAAAEGTAFGAAAAVDGRRRPRTPRGGRDGDGVQRRPRVEKLVPSRRRGAGGVVRGRSRWKAQLSGPRRPLRPRTGMRWVGPSQSSSSGCCCCLRWFAFLFGEYKIGNTLEILSKRRFLE